MRRGGDAVFWLGLFLIVMFYAAVPFARSSMPLFPSVLIWLVGVALMIFGVTQILAVL